MSPSSTTENKPVSRAVLARVVKQQVLKVPGVISVAPKPAQYLRRAGGVRVIRRRNRTIRVKAWITVAHDAGAVGVGRATQRAIADAVQQTSGEALDRVIVVIARMKMLRAPVSPRKGEAR